MSRDPAIRPDALSNVHAYLTAWAGKLAVSGLYHHGLSKVLAGSSVSAMSAIWSRLDPFKLRCAMSIDDAPRLPKLSPALNDSPTRRQALDQLATIWPYMAMSSRAWRSAAALALLSPFNVATPATASSPRAWLMGIVTARYAEPTSILVQVLGDQSNAARYACRNISWLRRPTSALPTMLLSLAAMPGTWRDEITACATASVMSLASGVMTPFAIAFLMSGSILPRIVLIGLRISSSMSAPILSVVTGISASTAALDPTMRLATLTS